MLQAESALRALLKKCVVSSVLVAVPLLAAGNAPAANGGNRNEGPVRLLFTIPVPVATTNPTDGMYGFDISFVDQSTQTYYLGDRSNSAVDAVDASTGSFLKQITASPPFAGVKLNATGTAVNNNISGPNGVATDGTGTCLFAGDGPSRVVSFQLPSGTQVGDVNTGGTTRADEMAFDPKDRLLLVVNNAETPPFATLISVGTNCTLTVGSKIVYNFATNGAEQPAWDPGTQRFYESIPSTSGTLDSPGTTGAIARINPLTATVETLLSVPFCMPAGLSLNPANETFLAGCSVVYDTAGVPWFGSDTNSANPV